ncbi:probable tRNA (uracil-O(2)-)-methyltransferase [Pantherophis guttatus]|uniref:tRNA (uracil-O(2)-)-methyltransferase n=1 Tax=Pantherophis guttatus TaxID=94885 RepID=A0A6P9D6Z0_PANGU|nr:probable tRNA (uracil-O(2)-)-methyltransferase [Pantherophis guttatus]
MEAAGTAALRDPAGRLPGGFWAAAAVWLERPQVANKRLSGACAEPPLRVPRAGGGEGPAERAWGAFCAGAGAEALGLRGPPELELELVLRRLLPRSPRSPAAPELVVRDVLNGSVTFLPLEQTCEGQYKVKVDNIYQIRLRHIQNDEWTVSVLLNPEKYVPDGIVYPKAEWLGSELISKLVKWSTEITKNEFKRTLSLISVARYSQVYQDLKEKYKEMVKVWPEVTDPEKFVYEDVAIATYLLILWEDERARRGLSKKQSFVDLGCGNGLLVHILSNEGHSGKGIDVRRRKIWDMYGPQTCLEESAINPNNLYPDVDWLIGNHSDELTPWIPVIAARSSCSCRYFLLPCCFFDFYGKYNRRQSQKSQYREYLDFVTEVGNVCGFNVEEDCLRIPSTKRVCLIGMSRTSPAAQDDPALEEERGEYIRRRQPCSVIVAPDKHFPFHREQSLSAAGQLLCQEAPRERDGRTLWPSGFLPRGKEQVRNCTTLPHAFVDQVALKVAHLLLSETEQSLHGPSSPWNSGESLPLSEIAGHLDKDTLKTLKKEYGGLQTLLRNNYQVFKVQHGKVRIRDWREEERPRKQLRGRQTRARLPSEATKTRLCWFDRHHPQGCPLPLASCPYAHGTAELNERRIVPGSKELLVQLC